MAMAFTTRVLENGARYYIVQVNGIDQAATTAATRNGLITGVITTAGGFVPTSHLKCFRILYNTGNCTAMIEWEGTPNVDIAILTGWGDWNLTEQLGMSTQMFNDATSLPAPPDIDLKVIATNTVTPGTNPITASVSLALFFIKGV